MCNLANPRTVTCKTLRRLQYAYVIFHTGKGGGVRTPGPPPPPPPKSALLSLSLPSASRPLSPPVPPFPSLSPPLLTLAPFRKSWIRHFSHPREIVDYDTIRDNIYILSLTQRYELMTSSYMYCHRNVFNLAAGKWRDVVKSKKYQRNTFRYVPLQL